MTATSSCTECCGEYRLVHGADHLDKSLGPRLRDGFRFLTAHVLDPPPADTSYAAGKAGVDEMRRCAGVPDNEPRPPFVSTTEPK